MTIEKPKYTSEKVGAYIKRTEEKFKVFIYENSYARNTAFLVLLVWLFAGVSSAVLTLHAASHPAEAGKLGFYTFVSFFVVADTTIYFITLNLKSYRYQLMKYKDLMKQIHKLKEIYQDEWNVKNQYDKEPLTDNVIRQLTGSHTAVIEGDKLIFNPEMEDIAKKTVSAFDDLYKECRQIQKNQGRRDLP